jgi:NAD(P)-dependent dehydrogenase (short-subunit alcohol dehydrogenase family)
MKNRRQQVLLKSRVAIITGGAKGIGRGIALKFAQEGCSIVIADIAETEGKKTAEEVSQKGGEGIFVPCDVTNSGQVRDMVDKAISKFKKIDILVNNAGGVPDPKGSLDEVSEEQWDRSFNLNMKSVFFCCQAVVPHMKKNKYGKIVNISSLGAVHPSVSVVHYHSAKAGVLGLTYNLAFELAPFNIAVNAILPGPVRTPFWEPVTRDIPDKDAYFDAIAQIEIPMRRVGTPEDIAGVALFLASELSAYVSAQIIFVGGGLPQMPHGASISTK